MTEYKPFVSKQYKSDRGVEYHNQLNSPPTGDTLYTCHCGEHGWADDGCFHNMDWWCNHCFTKDPE